MLLKMCLTNVPNKKSRVYETDTEKYLKSIKRKMLKQSHEELNILQTFTVFNHWGCLKSGVDVFKHPQAFQKWRAFQNTSRRRQSVLSMTQTPLILSAFFANR